MRKTITTLLMLFAVYCMQAQSNKEISSVYVKRAQRHLEKIEFKEALLEFNKAMKYADTIVKSNVAWLGAYINFEMKNYQEAKKYAKKYFVLQKDKKSEEYEDFLEVYVMIEEKILGQIEKEKQLALEQIKREKEKRRIDSLKLTWKTKSEELSIQVDSIFAFDKNNTAIFLKEGKYGILNDNGEIILKAETYQSIRSFDGYTLLLDREKEPRKIYVYNHEKDNGYLIPDPTEFNSISTNYGMVMLPRSNGKIVAYPNNSLKVMVYDIALKKFVSVENEKELFKELRKTDKIQKSNNDGQIKVNKKWYFFGGDLGAGVFPLFAEDYSLQGYLCSVDGKFLSIEEHQFIGSYNNGNYQMIRQGKTLWMNQNGAKVDAPINVFGTYSGKTRVIKKDKGVYQFKRNDKIIKGDQELEELSNFLKKHSSAIKS